MRTRRNSAAVTTTMLMAALFTLGSVSTAAAAPTGPDTQVRVQQDVACINGEVEVDATIGGTKFQLGANTGLECFPLPLV
ncbi:hypothetical protein [Streptomyces swartbergensis]|uniref:Uncharacterized protein n=1 Tax=Streptomyces swartbergensis TaxID=487165 RepID=A0A243S973_9ACTN|nr:hypothetical protein [Streptomyces swartbergensis]OUD04274.1 hypothetical protein CA983_05185 [Streptomyces swartbergensis]